MVAVEPERGSMREKKNRGDTGGNWRKGSPSLREPSPTNVTITKIKDV